MKGIPAPVPQASAAVRLMAFATPLTVAPSSLWRIAALMGVYGESHPLTQAIREDTAWVLTLSLGSLAAAFLTVGLVEPWGLAFPRFAPWIGGRRVPFWLAVGPAAAGAALALAGALYAVLNGVFHFVGSLDPQRRPFQLEGSEESFVTLLYTPLLATGVLLAIVTFDHARRRLRVRSRSARGPF